ncbi:BamA/TamA family outer membrane protein [Flavisolibacter nicotianae]|uniref:BamA/TamA family outer membrane protein n=1 Tax=Flavisolibacter nicotianae TaxID=2364882 RepID=UPI0013C47543|nr:BamA/TamA family outer membrane protein [Flavisolibacter nicotianae]
MRRVLTFCLLLAASVCTAQTDTISQRIFLIGDAGEIVGPNGTHPVIDWLQKNVDWNDERNTAIFLGDNIYPLGMPMKGEAGYTEAKQVIDYLMKPFVGKQGRAFFIPGNHDWENGKLGGLQRIRNQQNYINGAGHKNIQSMPQTGGCPGPDELDLNNQVAVVFIDSQWFLYIHDKPGPESSCASRTVDEFATQLKEIAEEHKNQLLLVVTHHPIFSFGVHGGDYTWKEHIFPLTALNKNLWVPLPGLGSVYPITRGVFGNLQDVRHPLYQGMAKAIEAALRSHPNAIIASGHDHSLQFIQRNIQKDTIYQIVSGAGSYSSRVKENRAGRLLFNDLENGLAMLEVHKSGKVTTRFYNIHSKDLSAPTFARDMPTITAPPVAISKDSIPVLPDSVLIAADPKLKGSGWGKLFLGENYRQEWTTPIRVPVLDVGKELGGLKPTKLGGGKQTKSLRVTDTSGKEWSLRSVEKYPEAAIPADLRETFVKDIVTQGISASYPFGSLSVEPMARAAGVPYHRKKVVYIPDDPRLGRFRSTFQNSMVIMEERDPEGVQKKNNTDEIVLKLAKDNDDHIDQVSVLRARLLDNFYMDFDRHEGQWDWASKDTGKGKIYFPIPKDQDQIFFTNQGILPYFARSPWLVPELQGFDKKAYNIRTFNKPARNFDRFFLNELTWETWDKQVDTFLSRMTDKVIEQALAQQPKEVRAFHYDDIVKKLKARRTYFKQEMKSYYDFLAKEVNVVGTNQRELFVLEKLPGNKLHVTVQKIDKNNVVSSKIYDRQFDGSLTRQLQVYGLEGKDSFVIRGNKRTSIKVRIIGGPDEDVFANESNAGKRIRVYDVNFEENRFAGNEGGFIKRISPDPRNNEYNRIYYNYGYFKPSLSVTYNVDDGVFLGGRAEWVTHGFRKDPYSTRHIIRAAHAVRTNSYYFTYDGDFTKVIGINDLLVRADLRVPVNVTNFFGIGNNTVFDKTLPGGYQYYRARYSFSNVSVLLRRHLQSWMRINYGPTFQYFHIRQKENAGKFLGNGQLAGVDMDGLYDRKLYAGAEARVDINSRNNPNLPTRGLVLDAGIKQLFGLTPGSNPLTQAHFDLSILASFKENPTAVYGFRLGWARNYGAFEIPQAQYLSGPDNLRGFRRNRFAGRSMLFQNTELRLRLADFNTYLFPGSLGLLFFNDIGRVYADNDKSGRWHDGYGGGIWLAPIRRWVITVSVAHSNEEKLLPYVSLGFRF